MAITMKYILIILSLFSLPCHAQQIGDKQLHLMVGTSMGAWSYLACPKQEGIIPVAFCITGATLAGVGKETLDLGTGGSPEFKDFTATITGGFIGAGIVYLGRKIFKRKNPIFALKTF